ncbi:MAG: hypothetical protein H0V66_13790 [Bdellovibrionales bacterium]|nr:hypothetical protein [Bdellovibrionales bacterium]
MKISISFLFLFLELFSSAHAETFTFDKNLEDWGSWGTGLGSHDANIGHNKKGSVWLSSDWGEAQTVHYNWNKLSPGFYKVTVYVRAQDVQPHSEGSSFWHFFDSGKGTENVFLSLHGNYEWRKVEYTLKVQKKDLSLWFRLRSPGQVWIDDLTIEPVSTPSPEIIISNAVPLKFIPKIEASKNVSQTGITILDFDKARPPNPFRVTEDSNSKKMGQFTSHKYYNLDPDQFLSGNWSKYDRMELDVFNGNKYFVEFYLTLGDNLSTNYWSQLNHKTHLAPGWNHLNFSLTQFLGERGSHRFLRGLNLSKLSKVFLVTDPNEKFPASSNYFVDNIKLSSNPLPVVPKGVMAFDFTSQKDAENSGFIKVTSQHLYNSDRGYGFISPTFWRVEDSQWAAHSLRYTIGVLKSRFKVKLPNGKYQMQLIIDRLGYWDPSFWKDRTVYINDRPVFKESRPYAKDYLRDWLQFEKIVPTDTDNPYDLYLKKIFKPLDLSFTVSNGEVEFSFEGDATGISLNRMIIWNTNSQQQAKIFLSDIEKRAKLEFDWMTRPVIAKASGAAANTAIATLIEPSLILNPSATYASNRKNIELQGGLNENPYQIIQLRSGKAINWIVSELKNKERVIFPKNNLETFDIVPQYVSPDLNHETYMLAGKYLVKSSQSKLDLISGSSKFICLQVKNGTDTKAGLYSGKITFTSDSKSSSFDIQIRVLPYQLPTVDFPVGFFGPDPISFSYFNDPGLEKIRKDFRHEALQILGQSGFTTFSGLPEVKLLTNEEPWVLDTTAADQAMTSANRAGFSKTYYSYGGKFPQQLFDGSLIPHGVAEKDFFKKVSPLLSQYLNRSNMPVIVHTFSDEAGGYSDKVTEDLALAKKIKDAFPYLRLGGFGSKSDKATKELRSFFDHGFYSNVSKDQMNDMGQSSKWGSYNASPGNLDDPRYSFGPGLYFARLNGLSHYLEWHASSINNLPYYDLDGRESDVTMFMPRSDGKLLVTLRYVMAVEGLHAYRKLKLLEQAISNKTGPAEARKTAESWLMSYKTGTWSLPENILRPVGTFSFTDFQKQLDKNLLSLYE